MSEVRVRVVVHGRVQGVFFRDSCQRVAAAHGVRGWVRNLADGASVEAAFEGPRPAVEAMVAWVHTGPPTARVDTVELYDEPPAGEVGFRVRR